MKRSSVCKYWLPRGAPALLLVLSSSTALAAEAGSTQALDDAVLAAAQFAPNEPDGAPVVIEQPARVRNELGAVIDAQPADGGLPKVMAITPGGAAARMDLRTGDRLLRVNGAELAAGASAGLALRDAVQSERANIDLQVQRAGDVVAISGPVERIEIPAYRLAVTPIPARAGCGRVNLALRPPLSEDIFPALLHTIDGRLGGPISNQVYRLSPGRHVLKLSEQIDGNRFWGGDNNHREQLRRKERFKFLELDVKPGITYRIGARFFKDRIDPVHAQDYWEPVVWKEFEEACR